MVVPARSGSGGRLAVVYPRGGPLANRSDGTGVHKAIRARLLRSTLPGHIRAVEYRPAAESLWNPGTPPLPRMHFRCRSITYYRANPQTVVRGQWSVVSEEKTHLSFL